VVASLGLESVHFLVDDISAFTDTGRKGVFVFEDRCFDRGEAVVDGDFLCLFKEALEFVVVGTDDVAHAFGACKFGWFFWSVSWCHMIRVLANNQLRSMEGVGGAHGRGYFQLGGIPIRESRNCQSGCLP
jgi:hypothetical protein